MKPIILALLIVPLLTGGVHANTTKRDAAFTGWIDADAECSRAYDAWLEAKVAEEAAVAQQNAALADWKDAQLRRAAAYAEWQKRSENK
jgi:hypothetical protein